MLPQCCLLPTWPVPGICYPVRLLPRGVIYCPVQQQQHAAKRNDGPPLGVSYGELMSQQGLQIGTFDGHFHGVVALARCVIC